MQRILTMAKGPMSISPPYLTWLILFGLAGFVAGGYAPAPAQAQQFSADLVIIHADGKAAASAGKLRVFNDKARIETPDFADGFFLIDATNRAAYFARPAERVFMDARQSSRLTQMFVPIDLSDPCRQWHDMATLAGATDRNEPWRCERVGEEINTDGRRSNPRGAPVGGKQNRKLLGEKMRGSEFPLIHSLPNGKFGTHPRVLDELTMARTMQPCAGQK